MSSILPPFTARQLLPAGDYGLTIDELRQSYLVTGDGNPSLLWDAAWRLELVDNLEILVLQLWNIGLDRIYVDGSFVEGKDHPSDIDGYFECDRRVFVSGHIGRALNAQDPFQIWDWSTRVRTPEKSTPQLRM